MSIGTYGTTGELSDTEAERQLEDLLADLDDEDIRELAALAEAMHAEGQS